MLKDLVKLANKLDAKGLQKEADVIDRLITASWGSRMLEDRNYMMDRRTNAKNAFEGYDPRSKTITVSFTKYLDDDDMYEDEDGNWHEEEEVTLRLPAKMEVCDLCSGSGKVVNPSIDAGGLTQDDFDRDPDFEEEYFSGAYDIGCPQCNGNNVMPVVNEAALDDEQKKKYYEFLEKESSEAAEREADRRTMMAEMGYGW